MRDPGPPATGRSYSAATLVRRLAAALGQPRGAAGGGRRRYILKLSSWNVLLLPWLLTAVWPGTPWLFIYRCALRPICARVPPRDPNRETAQLSGCRAPQEVAVSQLRDPSGWMTLRQKRCPSPRVSPVEGPYSAPSLQCLRPYTSSSSAPSRAQETCTPRAGRSPPPLFSAADRPNSRHCPRRPSARSGSAGCAAPGPLSPAEQHRPSDPRALRVWWQVLGRTRRARRGPRARAAARPRGAGWAGRDRVVPHPCTLHEPRPVVDVRSSCVRYGGGASHKRVARGAGPRTLAEVACNFGARDAVPLPPGVRERVVATLDRDAKAAAPAAGKTLVPFDKAANVRPTWPASIPPAGFPSLACLQAVSSQSQIHAQGAHLCPKARLWGRTSMKSDPRVRTGADGVQVRLKAGVAAANAALQAALVEQGCTSAYASLARHRQVESSLPGSFDLRV